MMLGTTDGSETSYDIPYEIGNKLTKFDVKYGLQDSVPSFLGFEMEFSSGVSCDMTAISSGLVESSDYSTLSHTVDDRMPIGFRAISGPDSTDSGTKIRRFAPIFHTKDICEEATEFSILPNIPTVYTRAGLSDAVHTFI